MTINEFKNIYASIAGLTWNFNAHEECIFLIFDTNSNGILKFDEFLMYYRLLQSNVSPVQRWSYVLNNYSMSQPRHISAQEAQLLLNNMQRFCNFPVQDTYFATAWSQLGEDNNGYVSASLFIQAVIPLIPPAYIW
ncbi:unnamed protein product [Rotaria magnacalcarata]|uniref:EF-hand domain-containing protein n=3 Tax=Rotaria magnacalcarata TaxID=392030 RepID=A0A816N188_9BILA|nr:unnamed protein product [Rotaria magnacalcarata]CAF2017804.1 unnamed protein product [Rotaria magnacalcarata]CAF5188376.1 unnamed protein product [Rotaria magnacalcarata]